MKLYLIILPVLIVFLFPLIESAQYKYDYEVKTWDDFPNHKTKYCQLACSERYRNRLPPSWNNTACIQTCNQSQGPSYLLVQRKDGRLTDLTEFPSPPFEIDVKWSVTFTKPDPNNRHLAPLVSSHITWQYYPEISASEASLESSPTKLSIDADEMYVSKKFHLSNYHIKIDNHDKHDCEFSNIDGNMHNIHQSHRSYKVELINILRPNAKEYSKLFGCSYTFELKSHEYPLNLLQQLDNTKALIKYDSSIPMCIGNYCKCEELKLFYKDGTPTFKNGSIQLEYGVSYTMPRTKLYDYNTFSIDVFLYQPLATIVTGQGHVYDLPRTPVSFTAAENFYYESMNKKNLYRPVKELSIPKFDVSKWQLPIQYVRPVEAGGWYRIDLQAHSKFDCHSTIATAYIAIPVDFDDVTSVVGFNVDPREIQKRYKNIYYSSTSPMESQLLTIGDSELVVDSTRGLHNSSKEITESSTQIVKSSVESIVDVDGPDGSPIPNIAPQSASNRSKKHKNTTIDDSRYLLIFIPIVAVLFLMVIVFAFLRFRKIVVKKRLAFNHRQKFLWKTESSNGNSINLTSALQPNVLYTDQEVSNAINNGLVDHFEIPYSRLEFGIVIGSGEFGEVVSGTAHFLNGYPGGTQVAIKRLSNRFMKDQAKGNDFLSEIDMMKRVTDHPNIVRMLGCCTLPHQPYCMIMEFVPHGDLKRYLIKLRSEFEKQWDRMRFSTVSSHSSIHSTNTLQLCPATLQISPSTNSEQLSVGQLVNGTHNDDEPCHCGTCEVDRDIPFVDDDPNICSNQIEDLACSLDPNELQNFAFQIADGMTHLEELEITHRDLAARNILVGRHKVLKISDFGLSRVGDYVKNTEGRIPLRWLSIEAIRNHFYSSKSDAWAYGIVLWEICTLGGFPYSHVKDRSVLPYIEKGNRLEKPNSCTDAIYQLMSSCWMHKPEDRPSFMQIKKSLDDLSKDEVPYVAFSPVESLPPEYVALALDTSMCSQTSYGSATGASTAV